MTLDEILGSNTNASDQLKKIFAVKALKSRIGNQQFGTSYFLERLQGSILGIVNGEASRFGVYGCCEKVCDSGMIGSPRENKIPEEIKPELIKELKKAAFTALENYKKELDDLFGGQEAPKEASTETENRGEVEGNDATESEPSVSTQEVLGQM